MSMVQNPTKVDDSYLEKYIFPLFRSQTLPAHNTSFHPIDVKKNEHLPRYCKAFKSSCSCILSEEFSSFSDTARRLAENGQLVNMFISYP